MVLVSLGEMQAGLSDEQVSKLCEIESPWHPRNGAADAEDPAAVPPRVGRLLTEEDVKAGESAGESVSLALGILSPLQEGDAQVPAAALDEWRKNGRTAEALLDQAAVRKAFGKAYIEEVFKTMDDRMLKLFAEQMKNTRGRILNKEDVETFEKGSTEQQAAIALLWILGATQDLSLQAGDLQKWRQEGRTVEALLSPAGLRNALLKAAASETDSTEAAQSREETEIREMFPPARKVRLGTFYIDKYEITNAKYRRYFEQASDPERRPGVWYGPSYNIGGPQNPKFYSVWDDPARNADDQPVTCVGEKDVLGYAAWAGKELPTRDEWERAARGDGRRLFPWGDDFETGYCSCNIVKPPRSQPGNLSALEKAEELYKAFHALRQMWRELREGIPPAQVGQFPRDVSPFGCHDMAGNVSELVVENGASDGELVEMGGNSEAFLPRYVCPARRSYANPKTVVGFRTILRVSATAPPVAPSGSSTSTDAEP